nr:NADH dehydrogenase subunit 3 [Nogodinidae sp.]
MKFMINTISINNIKNTIYFNTNIIKKNYNQTSKKNTLWMWMFTTLSSTKTMFYTLFFNSNNIFNLWDWDINNFTKMLNKKIYDKWKNINKKNYNNYFNISSTPWMMKSHYSMIK